MIETTTIDLLRHAECEGGDIFRGALDVALSVTGWQRMRAVAARGAGWQRIVASPMRRCRGFAEWLAAERGLPLAVDDRLREMSFGDWEGVAVARIWEEQAEAATAWFADPNANPPPGGEALSTLQQRARAALADVLQHYRGQHVLLVTHGGVMRVLIGHALDMPPAAINRLDLPWACLSRLAYTHTEQGDLPRLHGHNLAAA